MTLEAAKTASNADGKPVLIFATADWCGPCQSFKRGTLSKAGVSEAIKGKVHAVYVDIDKHKALASEMGIDSIPKLILMKGGKEVARMGNGDEQSVLKFLAGA